ncbi:C40 family peptidase [Cognatiyoonia sp. IB215182]|uniref:C40 family peptidase n=1 Tax=Cognatiyoonia sp. IB215182 TaxID=3097353 RepID=UPI002A17678D|nr:NlpC/P60 family protein [Cognatiyoonia sp. IB215182]MDX8354363.1 NlpC/P60 family protein [Cognatiyoonia sp. IB215182]
MSWANAYVGMPFVDQGRDWTGCDCWGLVRLVYAEKLDIDLLDYQTAYTSAAEHAEIAALINREIDMGPWRRTEAPEPFDVLLFRQGRLGSHVGIQINATKMLHMARGEQAKIEDIHGVRWGNRYLGAYRHVARRTPLNDPLKGSL